MFFNLQKKKEKKLVYASLSSDERKEISICIIKFRQEGYGIGGPTQLKIYAL